MARIETNTLSGIDGLAGLGDLRPGLRKAIYDNMSVVEKVLKQSQNLSGLGFVEGKKISFPDVVKMYNGASAKPKSRHGFGINVSRVFP